MARTLNEVSDTDNVGIIITKQYLFPLTQDTFYHCFSDFNMNKILAETSIFKMANSKM